MKSTQGPLENVAPTRMILTKEQDACYRQGLRVARYIERDERNLVENLIQAECLGLPKAFELSSLYQYAIQILGLTESRTGIMINVARKSKQIPALRTAIQNRQVSVSKAHKFCASVNEANVIDWLNFSCSHSAREIEDHVREHDPNSKKVYKFKMSPNAEKLLKRVQSLESQRQSRPVSKEEAMEIALEFFVDKKDPVKRADRALQRSGSPKTKAISKKVNSKAMKITILESTNVKATLPSASQELQFTGTTRHLMPSESKPAREPINAEQRNAVLALTRGCCTYVNSRGERCNEDRWIDIHHIKPIKDGGTNDVENLTVLCGFHHDLVHQLEFPFQSESRPLQRHYASTVRPQIVPTY